MVAPIALYPDQLLAQVLMAASYPQQILDAAQWLDDQNHASVKGDDLAQSLEPLPWDPSVKSLVAFPQIIKMMAEHIEWTQALGTAFASSESEVMTRIQALRHVAMKSGKLKSVKHLKVREEGSEVVITEEEPGRIFVPVYNPVVVYGNDWPDRDYAPVYLPPPQGFVAETIEPGVEVSVGYSVVAPLWGWSHPDWRGNRITVERDRYTRITRNAQISTDNVWHHSGPVVSVQNLPHRSATTAQVPAGTIAPASVGRQGQAAQTGSTTPSNTATPPGTNQPRSTGAAQPQTTQPRQSSTNPAQPNQDTSSTNKPGQASTTGSKTPAQNSGTTNAPDTNQATTTQPSKNEAQRGKGEATTNRSGNHEGQRNRNESSQNPTEHRQGTTGQPGQATGTANEPAGSRTNAARPNASEPGNAARQDERRRPGEREGAGRAIEHGKAPAENEMERDRTPPGSGSSQEQERSRERDQGQREQGRPNASQTPNTPSAAAPTPQVERRGPQHEQGAAPAAPKQAERPTAPPQGGSTGSSTPPAAAAPQRPQSQPGGHEKPRGEDEQKKER
jgi:hypothetical protein